MTELDDLEEIANLSSANGRKPRHNIFQLSKTHCLRGHPFDKENTRIGKKGRRICRACHRDFSAASAKKRRK